MTHTDEIFALIRRHLELGHTVDLDGVGSLRFTATGIEFLPQPCPRLFIAYVVEDLPIVRRLYRDLSSAGCAPWLDKEQLLAGQNWPRAIERAIGTSDAFIACFSNRALAKRGQFQSELRYALDCARRQPLEQSFIVPVRLESCPVPQTISDHTQYVDLFPDWDRGVERLLRSVRRHCP